MTALSLSGPLRQLADFADIRGLAVESAAWRRLAAEIDQDPAEAVRLLELAQQNQLGTVSRVPAALHRKLRTLLIDGPEAAASSGSSLLPSLLRRLLDLGTIGSSGAAALARYGIVTLADLDAALQDGRIAAHLPDFEDSLRVGVDALAFERTWIPLGRAVDLIEAFIPLIGAACPAVEHLTPAGDVRRFEPLAASLVIVGAAADPQAALDTICSVPQVRAALHQTGRRALVSYQHHEIDVRIARPDEFGTALFAATGSAAHVSAMREHQRFSRLAAGEEDVYAQAGLPYIAPELRHGSGEIEAAASGSLPALVERGDIRGDLHIHSTYSDGRDSLAEMVRACAALGYAYVAITDHSLRSAASRTLSLEGLARQRDEIAWLRDQYPDMAILHGIEVDIMPDGTLDFPDAVLESLDIVLASLHNPAGQDPARLTRRCLGAIEHPLVNVITHPANRLVGRDAGYDLDFPAVYAAAAATGTALEIDGAPGHLDMDGEHARDAVAAGATVTIDSDCHRARLLDRQMRMGIGTARRGWIEARHVLNARPLAAVRAFIDAKRRRQR